MIPLVGHVNEAIQVKSLIEKIAAEVMAEYGVTVPYKAGTMIELPRAAIIADQLAPRSIFSPSVQMT